MADWDEPGQDPAPWRSRPATLSPGPAPTGRDKVFDSVYGWLGGKPENRWAADKLTDVATLGGMAPWTAAYDGGRELAETGRPAALATALIPGARVAAPVAKAAEKAVEKGIRAFHGSPHDFDRFDLSKIGTGEGAQAYGHGLYFAENEGVARSYRDALAAQKNLNIPPTRLITDHISKKEREAISQGVDSFKSTLKSAGIPEEHQLRPWRTYHDYYNQRNDLAHYDDLHMAQRGPEVEARIADLEARWANDQAFREGLKETLGVTEKPDWSWLKRPYTQAYRNAGARINQNAGGRMYEVNIKADPEDFLDWDKPLSQQSEKVREVFDPVVAPQREKFPNLDPKGDTLYRWVEGGRLAKSDDDLVGSVGGQSASQRLREAGIPGVRYLDQGSRDAGDGSRNYAVWDASLIDIVRKYGIAGLLAAYYGGSPSNADAKTPQD